MIILELLDSTILMEGLEWEGPLKWHRTSQNRPMTSASPALLNQSLGREGLGH